MLEKHDRHIDENVLSGRAPLIDRIFIVGNGGSGKSWLAIELASRLQSPLTHLDDLHWLPNFAGERARHERDRLVAEVAEGQSWIMEGIYGSILRQVFSRVTTLIWLDIPDDECIANLMRRGQTDGGTQDQFEELLAYTRAYRIRRNHLNSFEAHQWFFDQHPHQKFRLSSRSEIADFVANLRSAN